MARRRRPKPARRELFTLPQGAAGTSWAMGTSVVSAAIARARSLLRRNDGAYFLSAGAVLAAAAAVAVGGTIWQLRTDAIDEARRDTANLAMILAEQTERSIQGIDLVLRELQDDITNMKLETTEALERA